jgi:hypothetical protein
MKDFILSREFQDVTGTFTIAISLPVFEFSEWFCVVRLTEASGEFSDVTVSGVDSLQAVQVALESMRYILLEGREATWHGDPAELGLPRTINAGYGWEVYKRLTRAHDDALLAAFVEREQRDPAFAAARKV